MAAFVKGFRKIANPSSWYNNPKKLGYAGLAAIAVPEAVHTYKAAKKGEKGEAALGGVGLGGLGLLAREVHKAGH